MTPSPTNAIPRASNELKESSRSSSPAPLPQSGTDDFGPPAPSGVIGSVPGPSVVSRLFGRLARKPSAQRTPSVDARDLELSADDFSYLAEVPSIALPPEKGVGDLLSMESGRSEQIASLESILASRPASVPMPLARPPRGSTAPSYSRTPSSSSKGSSKFVPKMQAPLATDIDLLSGLDFEDYPQSASSAPVPSAISSNGMSAWDDFLVSSKPAAPVLSNVASSSSRQASSPLSPTISLHPAQLPSQNSFSGFHDLETTRPANLNSFDEFGEFSAFDSVPPPASQLRPSPSLANARPPSTSTPSPRKASPLDHTPTMMLVNGASAVKGKRWPAPPSPIAPVLDPPPRAGSANAGFPFLSPPPPPFRPSSGLAIKAPMAFGDDLLGGSGPPPMKASMPPPPSILTASKAPAALAPTPPRSATPITQSTPSKPGLSAHDLSFFDSL